MVTDIGAGSSTTCPLAQAIHAANLANNPTNTTPAGATTLLPLSQSSAAVLGTGSCAGAQSGANTIELPSAATIGFSTDDWADNYWYGSNALTPIACTITIEGNGARLTMASGTVPRMRFFFIGADPQSSATPGYNTPGPGKFTLRNLQLSCRRQRGGGSCLGGAIFNLNGSLTVRFSTLAGNTVAPGDGQFCNGAAAGGAIYLLAYTAATAAGSAQATLSLHNSVLANTAGGSDLTIDQPASVASGAGNIAWAAATATGANLVMNAVQANNAAALPVFISTADPLLGALADNGGSTLTMALNPGSPAIDAGNACVGALPAVDQCGFARTAGVVPNLGAYESGFALFDGILANGFDVAAGCP